MTEKKGNGEVFEHYKCSFCDGFHIGHRTNFDWIPASHFGHRMMINKYQCKCGFEWFTSTVFSTRILTHFPNVTKEIEMCVRCPKCKNTEEYFLQGWIGRRWVNLEEIDPDSTESLTSLWDRMLSSSMPGWSQDDIA
jgi:hypothetical protein